MLMHQSSPKGSLQVVYSQQSLAYMLLAKGFSLSFFYLFFFLSYSFSPCFLPFLLPSRHTFRCQDQVEPHVVFTAALCYVKMLLPNSGCFPLILNSSGLVVLDADALNSSLAHCISFAQSYLQPHSWQSCTHLFQFSGASSVYSYCQVFSLFIYWFRFFIFLSRSFVK